MWKIERLGDDFADATIEALLTSVHDIGTTLSGEPNDGPSTKRVKRSCEESQDARIRFPRIDREPDVQ